MADRRFVSFALTVDYDRAMVSDRVHAAITAIMQRCGREIVGKAGLLANPDVLTLQALEWDADKGEMKPMNLGDV